MKEISEIRGHMVVSREDGAVLGSVASVLIDAESRRVAALSYRPRRRRREVVVERKLIDLVGRDVVLVVKSPGGTPGAARPDRALRSLKELQGTWVTTDAGRRLGTLVDLEVDGKDWELSELRLADGRLIPVAKVEEVHIGRDEIIVPASYEQRVQKPAKKEDGGVLGRLFGPESVDEVKKTIARTLRRVAPRTDAKGRANQKKRTAATKRAIKSRLASGRRRRGPRPIPEPKGPSRK